MRAPSFTVSNSYYIKECTKHGLSNHRIADDLCSRCHPKTGKAEGVNLEAVKWRHRIEDHQERMNAKRDGWFE